ncbi:CD209 antigen-like protein C isoform X2 [Eleutherodactylus coqui]|uniref:CD209 antigen-like protein C isoform X2 n=1 Tax=Eleutherodactylus coqui TaxID=57060 RepID=UPI0034623A81
MQNLYERSLDDASTDMDLSSHNLNETYFSHAGEPRKVSRGWMALALVVTLGIILIILCILTAILFGHYSTLHHEFSSLKSNDSEMKNGYSELWKSVDITEGSCKTCPPAWKMIKSNCYYFSSSSQTWERSKELCVERNGILLVIKKEFEMISLWPTIRQQRYWIGLKRNPENIDQWEWTDGSPLTFSAWNEGEPNNDRDNEHCAEVLGGRQSWNDCPCNNKLNYICKGVWTC